MKATVFSIKDSKSSPGVNDVVAFQVSETVPTLMGQSRVNKFYNTVVASGSCKLAEGEIIDIPMSDFDVKVSRLDNGSECHWLEPKI